MWLTWMWLTWMWLTWMWLTSSAASGVTSSSCVNPANAISPLETGQTDWAQAQDQRATATPAARAVATAWWLDVGAAPLRFSYTGQEPAVKNTFNTAGRNGALFNMLDAKVETGVCPQ